MNNYCEDTINVEKYQKSLGEFCVYPKERAIEYLALGLTSEAGEVAGKIKKFIRGDVPNLDVDAISAELGDVLFYVSQLATELNLRVGTIMFENLTKLERRKERNKLKGDGDNR